ncbi:MAG: ribose 5-phosphate isomerase B [Alphaproteobacteria bacterium]|nr:ribose 5-phosphate isomerase B [Alphaproteobacteria bacterium]
MGNLFLPKKIYIASDHAGFNLKKFIIESLKKYQTEVFDLGCDSSKNSVDYPDFANKLCDKIDDQSFGILICGSGIGISISANRHKQIRAALCHNKNTAKLARAHNNANVICLGARILKPKYALNICKTFLSQKFDGKRHLLRVEKLAK